MDTDLKEEEAGAGVDKEAKAGDVTNEDVMDLELESVTDVDLEDVLVETEDGNNMNVKEKEVMELEDEMTEDDKSSKEKDVFEKTAEVANVSDVQEEEVVKLNLPSNSSKKFKSKSLKVKGNIAIICYIMCAYVCLSP